MTGKSAMRLALRVEGDFWVGYCALVGTMDGAFEIGRIHMRIVADAARKQAFMALLQDGMAALIHDVLGGKVGHWDIAAAPEHERAGRA